MTETTRLDLERLVDEIRELIPGVSIRDVLDRRETARAHAKRIEESYRELRAMGGDYIQSDETRATGILVPRIELTGNSSERDPSAKNIMRTVDSNLWEWLLQKSGLWTFMDATARKQWSKQREDGTFPDLTPENVRDAFVEIHGQRAEMVARGVDELFQSLSRRHKTNRPAGFTKKIIHGSVASLWHGSYLSVSHHTANELDDLNRVLHVLRGIPEPEWQAGNAYQRLSAAASGGGDRIADFPYFTVRVFKKGTGHIVFKHDDDLKRLNAMLSVRYGGLRIATQGPHPQATGR